MLRRTLGKRRLAAGSFLLLAVALVIAACGGGGGATATPVPTKAPTAGPTPTPQVVVVTPTPAPIVPQRGGAFNVGITQQILNLDPHVATAFSSFRVMEHIYESLLKFDQKLALQPALAVSWNISTDGTVYSFKLRDGVKFHDGAAFSANDAKSSLARILDPATKSPQRSQIEAIDKVESTGPLDLTVTLKQPFAPFLEVMALAPGIGIVPADFATKVADPKVKTLGTGAFKLADFGPGSVKLSRHDPYWEKGLPYLDELTIRQIPDPSTLRAALRTGTVDLIFGFGVDATTAGAFAGDPGFVVVSVPELSYSLLGIQDERPPLNDVRVRQAISLAVDRQQLVEAVFFGRAAVGGALPPAVAKWEPLPPSRLPNYTTDIAKAKQLLKDAGAEGFTLNISPIPTVPSAVQTAQVLQKQLEAAGIKVNIQSFEFATWLDNWRKSNFDTFVSLNSGFTDPDIHLRRHIISNGATNVFKFKDATVDRLLQQGGSTTDPAKRKEIYRDLQLRIADQVPFLFLDYAEIFAIHSSRVQAFSLLPTQSIISLRETWLKR